MADQATDHLLNLLTTSKAPLSPAILNNLVYYIPRVRSFSQLEKLIHATFHGITRAGSDPLELFQVAQAIAQWKLQISEPVIPVSEFFKVWNHCFLTCEVWTTSRLAILGGLLSTYDSFVSIQTRNFIDDTGQLIGLYEEWKHSIFMPTWTELLAVSKKDQRDLVLLYSAISKPADGTNFDGVPWDAISLQLSKLLSEYMVNQTRCPEFYRKNLSQMAKAMRTSLVHSDTTSVNIFLAQTCRSAYNLNVKELNSALREDYSREYYSGILFTIVISMNSILQAASAISPSWYIQMLITLFNVNFIARKVGVVGFDSYESVYEVLCSGISMMDDSDLYYDILRTMRGNIWTFDHNLNEINVSKLVFLLNFMGSTLSQRRMVSSCFVDSFVEPLRVRYLDYPSQEIRELVHVMMLSLFENSCSGKDLLQWQAAHFCNHIEVSTDQFMAGKISKKQLIMIYQRMSSSLLSLQVIDKHLARDILHRTYLRILNSPPGEKSKQAVLIKCIIHSLAYLDEDFITDWLDTVQELLFTIGFDKKQTEEIIATLWNVLSHRRSDIALKWWYGHLTVLRSRL